MLLNSNLLLLKHFLNQFFELIWFELNASSFVAINIIIANSSYLVIDYVDNDLILTLVVYHVHCIFQDLIIAYPSIIKINLFNKVFNFLMDSIPTMINPLL